MSDFTHFTDDGRPQMVNVGEKDETRRMAVAGGRVNMSQDTLNTVKSGGLKKGDVLSVAQLAGIMGAKQTAHLIPLCHPLALSHVDVQLTLNEPDCAIDIRAECRLDGKTGVEMEALTAVSVAALTVYDMCKAVDKAMVIRDIRLLHKSGGKSGTFNAD
ncbi:MAG: cyclic pyranopterin monophosphate synthase MoaC [Candidatus Puniceispirillaceae bacterium]|jgi:cyclic pyranopterin phosphate synthase|tara:strand:+ start:590 stop:1066 length:477 start_codon:yes stop_codon:yes gene_type:complete